MMMGKKVGIVTLWKANYGSQLQCYATILLLKKHGFDGVLLQYKETNKLKNLICGVKNVLFREWIGIRYPDQKANVRSIRMEGKRLVNSNISKSLSSFTNVYLQPKYVCRKELRKLGRSEEYAYFFAGSDQVWNGACVDYFMPGFLHDVPKIKRVAFAASFGAGSIAVYNMRRFAKHLDAFSALSIREQGAEEIIRTLLGKECPVIFDPVLQLTADEWIGIIKEKGIDRRVEGKYIVAQFLDEPSHQIVDFIRKAAMYFSATIIVMPYDYAVFSGTEHSLFTGDPIEYLDLFLHAEYIVTDSFHGTAFSIAFRKEFIAVHRNYPHAYDQSERIISLLGMCGLDAHYFEKEVFQESILEEKIDYDKAYVQIEHYRKISKDYLESVLNCNNVEDEV